MKNIVLYLFITLVLVSSCRKEEDNKPVLAGIINTDFLLFEFNPPFQLEIKTDSLLSLGYVTDSFDTNTDGKSDLVISQRFLTGKPDSSFNPNDVYPFSKLVLKNGLEVATRTEHFAIGHGQTSSVSWVDTIRYNSRIDNITEWSGTDTQVWMWVVPPTIFWGSNGCWYNLVNTERFIAIRMKAGSRYKYGWIKLNQITRENISILNYTLEK